MLTSNARRIFCDDVTCFGTNKCCSNMGHLSGCFIKAPHFLLARLQLSTCFPISLSLIHLAASLYLCPADCFHEILFEQSGTCHSKMLGFLEQVCHSVILAASNWLHKVLHPQLMWHYTTKVSEKEPARFQTLKGFQVNFIWHPTLANVDER